MSNPEDSKFFALVSAVVQEGLAFVDRAIEHGRQFAKYDPWAIIKWSEEGMPDFDFLDIEPPVDYKNAFSPIWSLFKGFGGNTLEEFDFDTIQPYQELKQYIRSAPSIARNFFPTNIDEGFFGSSVKVFVEYLIDRYIHITGQHHFDSNKFLSVYLPLETGLFLEELPIQIVVPLLHVSLSSDSYNLTDGIEVFRMPTPLQLARAIRTHGTHDVNEYVLHQASHALRLNDYTLTRPSNSRHLSYEAETFPLDIVDALFAALRIVTSVDTGYAEILVVPVGWAQTYTADLLPLDGMTIQRYPPDLFPVNTFDEKRFPRVMDEQFASVRDLFGSINAIRNSSTKRGDRLRLAIKRLNSCFLRENEEDAILDATIGMEILLSDSETQEVTHKLALRLAALSTLVPRYAEQAKTVFDNVKSSIYPYRSAVVHGNASHANKKREIKTKAGEAIPAVKLATEYLGMAVQAVASNPIFLDPRLIDEKLLLGVTA